MLVQIRKWGHCKYPTNSALQGPEGTYESNLYGTRTKFGCGHCSAPKWAYRMDFMPSVSNLKYLTRLDVFLVFQTAKKQEKRKVTEYIND